MIVQKFGKSYLSFVFAALSVFLATSDGYSQSKIDENELKEMHFMISYVFGSLHREKLYKELEILKSQVSKIRKVADQYAHQAATLSNKLNKLRVEARQNENQSAVESELRKVEMQAELGWQEIYANTLKSINEVLLDHQVKRLKQIGLQKRLSRVHLDDKFGIFIEAASILDLTDEEKKLFIANVHEKKKEYLKKLEELNNQFEKKITKALPAKAQKKLHELIGSIYHDK